MLASDTSLRSRSFEEERLLAGIPCWKNPPGPMAFFRSLRSVARRKGAGLAGSGGYSYSSVLLTAIPTSTLTITMWNQTPEIISFMYNLRQVR
mmetsp:Transcript_90538/g.198387  ORF Transcript_90538/g.198387 Transcript_90538/m.198387 type:complete len:93 (-) Transcript_90538:450-728(-)